MLHGKIRSESFASHRHHATIGSINLMTVCKDFVTRKSSKLATNENESAKMSVIDDAVFFITTPTIIGYFMLKGVFVKVA